MLKHWGFVVVLLYGMVAVALTWPLLYVAFVGDIEFENSLLVYVWWPYWAGLAVMLLCQAALLLVPVRATSRRPQARVRLFWPLLASGLLVGLLVFGGMLSVAEFFYHDAPFGEVFWAFLGTAIVVWGGWTFVFSRRTRRRYAPAVISRQCDYLFKGSILELLVAVPTHVIARHRDYCCAGFMTFCGLVAGVVVLLCSFGPGVFLLYRERWRQLHPQAESEEPVLTE